MSNSLSEPKSFGEQLDDVLIEHCPDLTDVQHIKFKASILALIEKEEPRTWYVVDKDSPEKGGTIVLGPFTTAADAGVGREYIERKDTRDRTYWLEQRNILKGGNNGK